MVRIEFYDIDRGTAVALKLAPEVAAALATGDSIVDHVSYTIVGRTYYIHAGFIRIWVRGGK